MALLLIMAGERIDFNSGHGAVVGAIAGYCSAKAQGVIQFYFGTERRRDED